MLLMVAVASFTINDMLDAFLAEQRARLSESTFWRYDGVIDCFRSMLDQYAYTDLDKAEQALWEKRFNEDELEGSFCNTFGPEKITSGHAEEFCGYFMIRKVMGPQDMINATGTVLKKLVAWMVEHDHVDPETAKAIKLTATRAAKLLPAAEKLNVALREVTPRLFDDPPVVVGPIHELGPATISRVEPGKLWFTDDEGTEYGPIDVPAAATDIAQPGWEIGWLAIGQLQSAEWRILEIGFVYPDI